MKAARRSPGRVGTSPAARRRFLTGIAAASLQAILGPSAAAQNPATRRLSSPAAGDGEPSETAQQAAVMRAAHQVLDAPQVFQDPFALRIIGREAQAALSRDPRRFDRYRTLRAFLALRSRYAEDELAEAIHRGIRQYGVLGAGLDTYAHRNPHPGLSVFEVDHPATQRWKRARLAEAAMAPPASLTFAPVDFERETLAEGLGKAGFDLSRPAFFSLLGVAVYLSQAALMETLRFVAARPTGSGIVFDFSIPSARLSDRQREGRANAAQRAAALGEPWVSFYEPAELEARLRALGFGRVRTLEPAEAIERYFRDRKDGLRPSRSARLLLAQV